MTFLMRKKRDHDDLLTDPLNSEEFSEQRLLTRVKDGGGLMSVHEFDIYGYISRGAFGTVYLCRRLARPDEGVFAMKIVRKTDIIYKNKLNNIYGEREILSSVNCPFLMSLSHFCQTNNYVCFIMEFMVGGDLKNLIETLEFFNEYMAAFYIAECALALDYLHKQKIIHRDIKPDNMLISKYGHLKLTDFGLSETTNLSCLRVAKEVFTPSGHRKVKRTPRLLRSLSSGITFNKISEKDTLEECHMFHRTTSDIFEHYFEDNENTANNDVTTLIRKRSIGRVIDPYLCSSSPRLSVSQPLPAGYNTNYVGLFNEESTLQASCTNIPSNDSTLRAGGLLSEDSFSSSTDCFSLSPKRTDTVKSAMNRIRNSSIENDDKNISVRKKYKKSQHIKTNLNQTRSDAINKKDIKIIRSNTCPEKSPTLTDFKENIGPTNPQPVKKKSIEGRLKRKMKPLSDFQLDYNKMDKNNELNGQAPQRSSKHSFFSSSLDCSKMNFTSESPVSWKVVQHSCYSRCNCSSEKETSTDDSFENCKVLGKHRNFTLSGTLFMPSSLEGSENPCRQRKALNDVIDTSVHHNRSLLNAKRVPSSSTTQRITAKGTLCCKQSKFVRLKEKSFFVQRFTHFASNQFISSSTDIHSHYSNSLFKGEGGMPVVRGTPDYFAPELLKASCNGSSNAIHARAVDWWALGCCLYEFIYGYPPFAGESIDKIFDNIHYHRIEYDDENVPDGVNVAIKRLLAKRPSQRAELQNLRQMDMFKSIDFDNIQTMQPPYVPNDLSEDDLSNFKAVNRIRHRLSATKCSSFNKI